jgi:YD repeat-containing protein
MQGDSNHYVLVEEMYYDPLGNNSRHIRAIDVPFEGQRTFTTDHQYDSWGRVQRITYPDGETLRYHYSYGGELLRMYGHMPASDTVHYIQQLGYDHYGDRSYLRYGNGTVTEYTYTPGTRRMANVRMQSSDINSQNIPITLLDKDFSYTPAGNVDEVSSTGDYFDEPYNTLGGSYTHHYSYDGLNRLTTATGEWEGHSSHTEVYELSMAYNTVGGILTKQQAHTSSINGSPATDYSLNYSYSTAQPHALDEITDGTYTYVYSYDANGNMTQKTQDTDPIMAALWDEADRMRAVRNLNGISHYIYDANGQRLMKGGIDMDF